MQTLFKVYIWKDIGLHVGKSLTCSPASLSDRIGPIAVFAAVLDYLSSALSHDFWLQEIHHG